MQLLGQVVVLVVKVVDAVAKTVDLAAQLAAERLGQGRDIFIIDLGVQPWRLRRQLPY